LVWKLSEVILAGLYSIDTNRTFPKGFNTILVQYCLDPPQKPISDLIVSPAIERMVAVAQFLEIEPCFGQIETAI
jgi:hypothetical protein